MKDSIAPASEHGGHMFHDKGIDGIGHDGDIIHRLLAGPMEPKVLETANKKGPARAFLVQLAHSPETRKMLGEHLRNLRNVEGGDRQLTTFLKEEGFHTTIRAVHQALTEAKANDLLFWASRYHLFVHWSNNSSHPWDKLPGAERTCATLEIGKLRNSDSEAVVLLDGKPVTDFVFANGILKTTAPLAWATPSGETASVHLHLQFSAFAGYGEGPSLSSYLGVQAHGILWAAPGSTTPAIWPFTPPIVSAKVNMGTRDAALAPGGIDPMSFFEGSYDLQPLSSKAHMAPVSICISSQNGRPAVTLNGQELSGWTFDYNNVLAWADQAGGYSAWLQALVLPGGPVFIGKVTTGNAYEAVDVMGERAGQASQIAPDAQLDHFVGQQVAAGLATASIVVLGHLMHSALELWAAAKGDNNRRSNGASKRAAAAEAAAEAHSELLDKIGAVNEATEDVFAYGSDVRVLDPAAGKGAEAAQQEAGEAAQSAKTACNSAVENLEGVRAAVAAKEVLEAAQKASIAACRAHSAGKSALVAEESAVAAADLARAARTQAALYAAMTAAQSYHEAKACAVAAVRAAAEAAELGMGAVEAAVAHYVELRDYARLKDMAEASSFAGQALKATEDAEDRWVANSADSRREALQCAQAASDFAAQTYKHLRLVHDA